MTSYIMQHRVWPHSSTKSPSISNFQYTWPITSADVRDVQPQERKLLAAAAEKAAEGSEVECVETSDQIEVKKTVKEAEKDTENKFKCLICDFENLGYWFESAHG